MLGVDRGVRRGADFQRQSERKQHSGFGKPQDDSCLSLKVEGAVAREKLRLFNFFPENHSFKQDAVSDH